MVTRTHLEAGFDKVHLRTTLGMEEQISVAQFEVMLPKVPVEKAPYVPRITCHQGLKFTWSFSARIYVSRVHMFPCSVAVNTHVFMSNNPNPGAGERRTLSRIGDYMASETYEVEISNLQYVQLNLELKEKVVI